MRRALLLAMLAMSLLARLRRLQWHPNPPQRQRPQFHLRLPILIASLQMLKAKLKLLLTQPQIEAKAQPQALLAFLLTTLKRNCALIACRRRRLICARGVTLKFKKQNSRNKKLLPLKREQRLGRLKPSTPCKLSINCRATLPKAHG